MNLEIRTNGKLDYKQMLLIRGRKLANKVDRFFVEGHWPTENPA